MRIQKQAETFAWRTAATTRLYRGLAVMGVPQEQQNRWADAMNYNTWDGDPKGLGKHLSVGPEIIKHLEQRQGGVGRHWTTNPERALDFAGRSMENRDYVAHPNAFPAVLSMDWDGQGLDESDQGMNSGSHNWDGDDERVLQKGHQGKIHGVKVNESSLGGWTETLNPSPDDPDFGHLHRPGYGHLGVI
jgi:hypothetical protein